MTDLTKSARWFLAPWAIGYVALTLLPLVASLVLSFTEVETDSAGTRYRWVGADHYRAALGANRHHDPKSTDQRSSGAVRTQAEAPRAWLALSNTLVYTAVAVPLGLLASLAAALLLSRPLPGMRFFRACFYLPHVLGGVATIVIWSWLFNPRFGWVNRIVSVVYAALDPLVRVVRWQGTSDWALPAWLYSPTWCKPALILMHLWAFGGAMLIFLAALRRIPPSLPEAARIDGAGAIARFLHITWPRITPAVVFNLTIGVIFAMQSFTEPYLLHNRAQQDGLLFFVPYLYGVAFEPPYEIGYASALSWILLILLAIIIGPILWSARRWAVYAEDG